MKTLKEIGWWSLSLIGALVAVLFLAPNPDSPMQSLAFPFISTLGFIICGAASLRTRYGQRIMARHND